MTTLKFPQCFTTSSFTPRKKYSCIHTRTFVKTVEILEQQLFCIIPYPSICHIIPGFSFNMNHQAKVGSNSLRDRRKKGVGRERENPRKKRERKLTLYPQILPIPYPFRHLPLSSQTNTCRLIRELKQRRRRPQRGREKSNRFRLAKQQLCTCITLFCTFLCCRCTTSK